MGKEVVCTIISKNYINSKIIPLSMAFSKSFPRQVKGSNYPSWEEISLTAAEEAEREILCRKENIAMMKECIEDAKSIIKGNNLKDYQTDIINLAISLFEKRASHSIYWKESKAKEKFDRQRS